MALTALDFPASPTNGQLYPDPPVTGQPQYIWNGTQWLSSKAAVTQIARTDALGWSGMQINGSMEVSQELGTTGTTVSGKYICDGWVLLRFGTSAVNAVQSGTPLMPGTGRFINIAVTTAQPSLGAGDAVLIQQAIEGYRISRLGWGTASAQPITIGFWSNHNRTGLYSGAIRNGAVDRTYIFTYTHNVASASQYNTVTIPGDTTGVWAIDNTAGLNIAFTMASGTANTTAANTWTTGNFLAAPTQTNGVTSTSDFFRITGVVVLPGIEAPTAAQSPLIMRPYDQELMTCQRYFEKINISSWQPGFVGSPLNFFPFKVEKRISPTVGTWQVPTYGNSANTPVFNAQNTSGMTVGFTASAFNSYLLNWGVYADARL